MSIPIGLTEDNAVNRNTFMQKISLFDDLTISFVAENGDECLRELNKTPFSLHPKIVFTDIEMPVLDGIQTIQMAKTLYPHIHFIILTVFDDDEKIFEAIRAGASGYLLKDENAIGIRNAITNVMDLGGAPMSPAIARKSLELLSRAQLASSSSATINNEIDQFLSQREKEILQHTINGLDAKRISELLNISVLTVRIHVANIYQRLHVNSKAQVMHLAHQRKWFK
jgi:DNA-binding NarL/FixJ family response regulator